MSGLKILAKFGELQIVTEKLANAPAGTPQAKVLDETYKRILNRILSSQGRIAAAGACGSGVLACGGIIAVGIIFSGTMYVYFRCGEKPCTPVPFPSPTMPMP